MSGSNLTFSRSRTAPTAAAVKHEVMEIAHRIERLGVSHRDPERFFIERSAIAGELRKLARRMGSAA